MSIPTPAALFRLSDFAEHTDPSGEAWRAFQEVDAHITALHTEVERLTADLDEMRAMWDQDSAARHRLLKEVRQLDADLAAARAERDGLAKALASGVDDMCEGWCGDGGRGQFEDCFGCRLAARAALAALPTKEADNA